MSFQIPLEDGILRRTAGFKEQTAMGMALNCRNIKNGID